MPWAGSVASGNSLNFSEAWFPQMYTGYDMLSLRGLFGDLNNNKVYVKELVPLLGEKMEKLNKQELTAAIM